MLSLLSLLWVAVTASATTAVIGGRINGLVAPDISAKPFLALISGVKEMPNTHF